MALKAITGVDASNQKIINLADATAATDAAAWGQVQNLIAGLAFKNEVRAATTTNGTLASAYANASTIDGVTLATGDRILLKDQTTQTENGIYTVNASGAPTRATDADTPSELNNATVLVTEGTVNANRMYTQTTKIVTIGTTNVTWAQFISGVTYTAGNGISVASNIITAIAKASGGLGVDSGGIYLDVTQLATLNIPRRYAVDVPASTPATITHSLGTKDVAVHVFLNSTGEEVYPDVARTSTTVVTLTFATAPSAAQYRCVVIG